MVILLRVRVHYSSGIGTCFQPNVTIAIEPKDWIEDNRTLNRRGKQGSKEEGRLRHTADKNVTEPEASPQPRHKPKHAGLSLPASMPKTMTIEGALQGLGVRVARAKYALGTKLEIAALLLVA